LAARSSELAVRLLHQELSSALSCVSLQRFAVLTPSAEGTLLDIQLPDSIRLRLATGGPSFLNLDASFQVETFEDTHQPLRRRWNARIRMYSMTLLDAHNRELLTYHWHPGTFFLGPNHPHIHVSAALDAQVDAVTRREIELDKLHLVTGIVSLAAFVRMLIAEFGVAPLRHDWRETLDRTDRELRAAEGAV